MTNLIISEDKSERQKLREAKQFVKSGTQFIKQTQKLEKQRFSQEKEERKKLEKEKKTKVLGSKFLAKALKEKILKKPTARIQEINPNKVLSKGLPKKASLIREGRSGNFNNEYEKETKWLS